MKIYFTERFCTFLISLAKYYKYVKRIDGNFKF